MSTSGRVLKSSAFLLTIQVVQRSLGIISTLILARLLTPEHFGIVALVTIALQFFELLVETGNRQYIIQKSQITDNDLNTAWSMDIAIKTGICLIIIFLSGSISTFFETPELAIPLCIASLALPLRALKTPGVMLLAKEINYRPLFRLTLSQKGISFITVVSWALISPSHWAVIAGTVISAGVFTVGSYYAHPFRPHWTLINARQQWQFSRWLLLRGIVGFTRSQIDNLIVSRWFGTAHLGGYNLVREISLLPALSAILPISEPLLAAIAESKHDHDMLAYRIRLSLALMITVLTPITMFIMLYPELIVTVLLGSKWEPYAHLLQPFGLFFFTFCLFSLTSDAIIAQGKVKPLFLFDLLSTIVIISLLFALGTSSLDAIAWTRGWLAVITTVALLFILNHWASFNFSRLVYLCLPTLLASSAAAWATTLLDLETLPLILEFLIRGTLFVVLAALLTLIAGTCLLGRSEEWLQLRSILRNTLANISR